jgi:predicted dinucleotide-binding enzyme
MKIAFIGIGNVGFAIANNLQKAGHQIFIGHNNPRSESVRIALEKNPSLKVLSIQEAVDNSALVLLAVPYRENETTLKGILFNGKTLVDCTNPVGPGITHALNSQKSGSEMVQEWASDAKVVRAFNIYGYENFENNSFPNYNVKPVMPIAGNDGKAKDEVSSLLEELGYLPLDTGELSQSLHLEHMTLLWIKMVRKNGHHPNFVWAYLER